MRTTPTHLFGILVLAALVAPLAASTPQTYTFRGVPGANTLCTLDAGNGSPGVDIPLLPNVPAVCDASALGAPSHLSNYTLTFDLYLTHSIGSVLVEVGTISPSPQLGSAAGPTTGYAGPWQRFGSSSVALDSQARDVCPLPSGILPDLGHAQGSITIDSADIAAGDFLVVRVTSSTVNAISSTTTSVLTFEPASTVTA